MANRTKNSAWLVALVTFTVLVASAGVRTAPSILLKPWEVEFGWSSASISLAVAISFVTFGLGGPFVGTLIDRLGARRMMLGGIALVTAGLAPLFFMRSLWQLQLLWGVLVGAGTGALGSVLGATVATRWFPQNRGFVLGLFGTASAVGQLLFYPTLTGLAQQGGWRIALGTLALICIALLVLVALLVKDRPTEHQTGTSTAQEPPIRLGAALRRLDFWLLAGTFFICGYTSDGTVGTHLITHAVDHGITPATAAGTMSLISVTNTLGAVLSGWLTDRVENRRLLAAIYGLRALALLSLPFVAGTQGLFVFAIIMGLDWNATVPLTVNLIVTRFGQPSLGKLYGWIFCAHMVGAGLASYAGGFLRDLLGSYTVAFLSAGALGVMAVAMVTRLSPSRGAQVAPEAAS